MEHDGHRERLRTRYQKEGLSGFAPHEVLELLLTYAIPRIDLNPVAHQLMDHFGSFCSVLEATPEELAQVPGIGPQSALFLSMLLPVLKMYGQEKLLPKIRLNTYPELASYCHTLFLGVPNEHFYVLCFDARLQLLATELIATGTPSEVQLAPRMVVRTLIRHNAVGAVVAHNHPSGSLVPSREDVEMTRRIQVVLEDVGVRLYDHVLIAGAQEYSFNRNGLLTRETGALPPEEEDAPQAADRPERVLRPRKK